MTDLKQVNDDLDNWRNYYRDRKSQRVTFSLEGRYKPDALYVDGMEKEILPPPRMPVDARLAVKYEIAIVQLPFTHKACLVIDYMYRWALNEKVFHKTCRIAKVKPSEWTNTVEKAKLMLINKMR